MRPNVGADVQHDVARPNMIAIDAQSSYLEAAEQIDRQVDALTQIEAPHDAVPLGEDQRAAASQPTPLNDRGGQNSAYMDLVLGAEHQAHPSSRRVTSRLQ